MFPPRPEAIGLFRVSAATRETQECGGYRKQRTGPGPLRPGKPSHIAAEREHQSGRRLKAEQLQNVDVSALVGAYIPGDDGVTEVCDLGQTLDEQRGKWRSARVQKPQHQQDLEGGEAVRRQVERKCGPETWAVSVEKVKHGIFDLHRSAALAPVQARSGGSFDSRENNPDNSCMRLRIPIHTKAMIAA
jgi:hypothetical protein